MTEPIHIEIIISEQLTLCKSDCGTDWSLVGTQRQVRKDLSNRFGNHVRVDFKQSGDGDRQINNENNYPILSVNRQTRLTGQFDIRQVIDIVEIQMEIGAQVQ